MAGSRNKSLDALKGLAILLVMFGHVLQWNKLVDIRTDPYLYRGIDLIQMPLFMAVSGYIAGLSKRQMDGKNLKTMIAKRTVSYLVPFLMWIIVMYMINIIIKSKEPLGSIVMHMINIIPEIWATLKQPDHGLWFLLTLYILTLLLFVAQYMEYKIGILGFYGAIFVEVFLIRLQIHLKNDFLAPEFTFRFMPFFIGAYLISRYWEIIKKITPTWEPPALFILCFPWLIVYFTWLTKVPSTSIIYLLVKNLCAACGCYICFYIILKQKETSQTIRFLCYLGAYTLEIYAIHFHFSRLIPKSDTLSFYSIQGVIYAIAAFVLMSIITAGCIFIIKKIWIADLLLFGKTKKRNLTQA